MTQFDINSCKDNKAFGLVKSHRFAPNQPQVETNTKVETFTDLFLNNHSRQADNDGNDFNYASALPHYLTIP